MNYFANKPWISGGLAMFSMFFGAGNLIFPLMLGQASGSSVPYAMIGLFLTAILVPFSGLVSITLFDGEYTTFFQKIGKYPGFLLTVLVLLLIGPFGAIPRVISFTFSTCSVFFPSLHLSFFSFSFACVTYMFCMRKSGILDILGNYLTPVLLLSLATIVIVALTSPSRDGYLPLLQKGSALFLGIKEGYNTMDLLGAFFFSSIVCSSVRSQGITSSASVVSYLFKASALAATLLTIVYTGLAVSSAHFGSQLAILAPSKMLGGIGILTLGPYAGLIVALAVGLSCLTTAIALAAVSAEFIQTKITNNKISYNGSLIGVLVLSAVMSLLDFNEIVALLAPVLMVFYPSLIALSFANIANKLRGFTHVKEVFYITLFLNALYVLRT